MLIQLPELPPPLSACYTNPRGRPGRIKTARYKAWENLCLPYCNILRGVSGKVRVIYQFKRPDNRIRDLGNLEKATSDLLVKSGMIDDDSDINSMWLFWAVRDDAAPVEITIEKDPATAGDGIGEVYYFATRKT